MIQLEISAQYSAALLALAEGGNVRRASWPADWQLSKKKSSFYLHTNDRQPAKWPGPSEDEARAVDWVII